MIYARSSAITPADLHPIAAAGKYDGLDASHGTYLSGTVLTADGLAGCPAAESPTQLAAELGAGFGPGMDLQFSQHPLGMVPGRMRTDAQGSRDADVGLALGQEAGYFRFSGGQSELHLEIPGASRCD